MQAVYENLVQFVATIIYQSMWTPKIGELLICERELTNPTDR